MTDQRKHYAERDIMAMDRAGNYYCRHVSAMTGEGLHSKSDIAAELGFRDQRIDALLSVNAELLEALETARDYVAGELEQRKQALAGYPDKWRIEEQDLAAIDAAITKARSQS